MRAIFITFVLASLALLCACTMIHIEGDGNRVSDVGGHNAAIELPAHDNPANGSQPSALYPNTGQ